MAPNRILVVDDSAAMRETLGILLGGDFEVRVASPEEYAARELREENSWNLVILGNSGALPLPLPPSRPEVPVLWLVDRPESGQRRDLPLGEVLPRRFSPFELRRKVAELLSTARRPAPTERMRSRLEPPFVPPVAARLIQRASTHDLPLLMYGEPGVGKRSIASALNALRGGPFLPVRGPAFHGHPLAVDDARQATLFLDRVDQLAEEGQQRLLDLMQPGGVVVAGGARLRIVAAAEKDLSLALERGEFLRELYHRLTVLIARLPPLRERTQDIPDLVQLLVREIAPTLGLGEVKLTAGAVTRLQRYLWFGNVAELEAVLARTLSIAPKSLIDADDLLFDTTPLAPGNPAAAVPSTPRREALTRYALDLVANELAHELKNPMVTIKTFAQHQRKARLSGDEQELARLTGEAIDQIDQVVENLLEFTRFGPPDVGRFALANVLSSAVDGLEQRFGAATAAIEPEPAPACTVAVDLDQVSFAIANLLRTLTRGLAAGDVVRIRHRTPGTIVVSVARGGEDVSSRLTRLLPKQEDAETATPLGIAIADALIERNGGTLRYEPRGRPPSATIQLRIANSGEVGVAENGTTARTGR